MASDEGVPPDPAPLNYQRPERPQPPVLPAGTTTLGMWLFLASLFMLFASAMVGYILIRIHQAQAHALGTLKIPNLFWLSTALVIGVSLAMANAVSALRRERQQAFLHWLNLSLALAVGFLVVQGPALAILMRRHEQLRSAGLFLYGLVFFLVLLHALHVVGGMIVLIRVSVRARHGAYDHEHYNPVRHTALYWHFLDIVWLLMFGTLLLTA